VATDWVGDPLPKGVHSNDFDLFAKTGDNSAGLLLAESTRFEQIFEW
jgi:hypothetical protein